LKKASGNPSIDGIAHMLEMRSNLASDGLIALHINFFDFAFMRLNSPSYSNMSDSEIAEQILAPQNENPPRPNLIFDPVFYAANIEQGEPKNPILHYLSIGTALRADPNAIFDAIYYENQNFRGNLSEKTPVEMALQTIAAGLNNFHPFLDIDTCERTIGRKLAIDDYYQIFSGNFQAPSIHPLIDFARYSKQIDHDVTDISAFVESYWREGRNVSPHILFDPKFYTRQQGTQDVEFPAFYHYLTSMKPKVPHPLIDAEFYAANLVEFGQSPGTRPLEHWLKVGTTLAVSPSPFFATEFYEKQSGVSKDCLLHYIESGHRRFSPHPLISLKAWQKLCRQTDRKSDVLASVLADGDPEALAACLIGFDPGYYGHRSKIPGMDSTVLARHYLMHNFGSGELPNGLWSSAYVERIDAEISSGKCDNFTSLRTYLAEEGPMRPRLCFFFKTLDDSPEMQVWLKLLGDLSCNQSIEIIVLAENGGPLELDFKQCAHVWMMGIANLKVLAYENIRERFEHFVCVLGENLPVLAVFAGDRPLPFLTWFEEFGVRTAALMSPKILRLNERDLKILMSTISYPIYQSKALQEQMWNFAKRPLQINSDYLISIQKTPSMTESGQQVAHRYLCEMFNLSVSSKIVLGSGPLDLAHGLDLFGAVAAFFCRNIAAKDTYFFWVGSGSRHASTPVFFAQHQMRIEGFEDRFLTPEGLDLDVALGGADAYLCCARDPVYQEGVLSAKTAGLGAVQLVAPDNGRAFDIVATAVELKSILDNGRNATPPAELPPCGADALRVQLISICKELAPKFDFSGGNSGLRGPRK